MDTANINDIEDSRLAVFLQLKDRDVRRETGLFIAEGEHVVRRAFEASRPGAGLRVRSVLVVEGKADRVEAMIAETNIPGPGAEVLVCSKEVMAQAVGMKLHQGIIAAVEPPPPTELDEVVGGSIVVCPEITNVENLGLLVRVCAGLGAQAMVLGPKCCDPWYRRAVRVSMGAVFTLPMVRSVDMDADLGRLRDEFGYELVATVIDEDAEVLHGSRPFSGGRGAILLGSEGYGLPPEMVERCDRKVRIPMHHDTDSLNVAVAAGIVIHHFAQP